MKLFNGKNLDGWGIKIAGQEMGDNYGDTFRVRDGVIAVSYDQYKEIWDALLASVLQVEAFALPAGYGVSLCGRAIGGWAFLRKVG